VSFEFTRTAVVLTILANFGEPHTSISVGAAIKISLDFLAAIADVY